MNENKLVSRDGLFRAVSWAFTGRSRQQVYEEVLRRHPGLTPIDGVSTKSIKGTILLEGLRMRYVLQMELAALGFGIGMAIEGPFMGILGAVIALSWQQIANRRESDVILE